MEFNEKLQELRKQKNMTQDELAEHLYVSRTAISKWESGRGYPSIDSLKEIAKYFSVTIDELLSSNEVLSIAEEDNKQKENGIVQEVSLLSLNGIATYLKTSYYAIVISIAVYGILTLTFQNYQKTFWVKNRNKISLILNVAAVLLFIISSQPYAGTFLFIFLIIKALMLIKWQ